MDRDKLIKILNDEIVDSIEVRELLNCSRQYVNELVSKDKLIPIKKSKQYTLFSRSDVLKLKNKGD
jgi:hypothetical protein